MSYFRLASAAVIVARFALAMPAVVIAWFAFAASDIGVSAFVVAALTMAAVAAFVVTALAMPAMVITGLALTGQCPGRPIIVAMVPLDMSTAIITSAIQALISAFSTHHMVGSGAAA